MNKLLLTFTLLLLASTGLAQDMNSQAVTSKKVPASLKTIINNDKTDEHVFISGKYYCHNFASQFFLQNSSLVSNLEAFDLKGMAADWGTIISMLAASEKLPIYYVSLSNDQHGFYHAINAYLMNPEKPDLLESYIFIEPQTDETFLLAEEIYNRYRKYYDKGNEEEVLKIQIGTLDAFKSNGSIYQSFTSFSQTFDVKFK